MAEDEEQLSEVNPPNPPPFLDVSCNNLKKTTRFAAGTKAGFAVSLINRKLATGSPLVLHIEAVKDGEEPISFGPDAVLVDYGRGWKLQTVSLSDYVGAGMPEPVEIAPSGIPKVSSPEGSGAAKIDTVSKPTDTVFYIAKILLAFILIFVLGVAFTLALENLPRMILFVNSFM